MITNFIGRLLLAVGLTVFGYLHLLLEQRGKNQAKIIFRNFIAGQNTGLNLTENHFNQLYLGVSYILLASGLILFSRKVAYLVIFAYTMANLHRYTEIYKLPRSEPQDILSVIQKLTTDLAVYAALLLASAKGK